MATAEAVDSQAVAVARAHRLTLDDGPPRPYEAIEATPAVVVSVRDRAREDGLPWEAPQRHWSVADPHGGDVDAYEAAFQQIARRVDATAVRGPS